jgi:hypothetical protein
MQQSAAIAVKGVFQETGTVVEVGESGVVVETPSGRFPALCAVSCLVAPAEGDRVLVAVPPLGELYVLAVLARTSQAPLVLRLDTSTAIECAGELSILGTEAVELRSPGEVRTTAKVARTTAVEAVIATDRLSVVSRLVEANAQHVKGVLGIVDTVLDRLSQRVKNSYRFVEELDLTRAKSVDLRASETVHVRGQNAFMTADDLVKMQAQQIHLG